MVFKRGLLLVTWMLLTLTGFADTLPLRNGLQLPGMFEGGASRFLRFRTDSGIREYDILSVFAFRVADALVSKDSSSSFGPEQERFIREWFSKKTNSSNLPPGMARHEILPPALQRRLQRNGTLPAGLEQRIEPLPLALEHELPPISDGMHRVILAGNIILLEDATSRIVDLIRNVF